MSRTERALDRVLHFLDAFANRFWGWRWNPLYQSGTIAAAMLLVLLISGVYLLLFYRVSSPSASVAGLAADPWLGSWIRSLHRYATDIFVLAAVLHAVRMFAQSRSWGRRTLAWISGLALLGVGIASAWTGFVMAWDSFGERLALDGVRLFDALPIFSEPLSRIFAGDSPVPSAFFFVTTFLHIALPLTMGAGLWIHVSRVARPTLLPPRRMLWTLVGALVLLSVAVPAALGDAADPFRLPTSTPTSLVFAWWLPLSERVAPAVTWMVFGLVVLGGLLVPRIARRPREGALAPSVVDPALCTGCNQCPQDCPWEAITMVARTDGRPTLVALVDPAKCVSCGICAASCAPMGVGPPGRTGRNQLAVVRSAVLPELSGSADAPIVAAVCSRTPARHVEALRARGAYIHTVSCAGNLHTSVIEVALRGGAPGVIVYACPPRDCVGREGPKWLHERVYNDREAELQARVDRRRVRIATAAPGGLGGVLASFDAFASDLAQLAQPSRAGVGEVELECESLSMTTGGDVG
jgi:ferredoxin